MLLDGVIDSAVRLATGYWPREIAAIACEAAIRRPELKGDVGYHRFAAYEMTRRLGAGTARLLGRLKERSDAAGDSRDLRNNEIGIAAAVAGLPNPVLRKEARPGGITSSRPRTTSRHSPPGARTEGRSRQVFDADRWFGGR
jgi:hypothetical protein